MSHEFGQLLHNNPVGAPCPALAHAIMSDLRDEIARVYWNVNQKQWAAASDAPHPWSQDEDAPLSYDTGIPGVEWRPYYNWGGSPEDADWDQSKANAPNFAFEGVEIRWYKRFGRSLNCNVVWPAEKWNRWYERCLQTLRAYEDEKLRSVARWMHHQPASLFVPTAPQPTPAHASEPPATHEDAVPAWITHEEIVEAFHSAVGTMDDAFTHILRLIERKDRQRAPSPIAGVEVDVGVLMDEIQGRLSTVSHRLNGWQHEVVSDVLAAALARAPSTVVSDREDATRLAWAVNASESSPLADGSRRLYVRAPFDDDVAGGSDTWDVFDKRHATHTLVASFEKEADARRFLGSFVFASPPVVSREAVIEECARVCDAQALAAKESLDDGNFNEFERGSWDGAMAEAEDCAKLIRALSTKPATVGMAGSEFVRAADELRVEASSAWSILFGHDIPGMSDEFRHTIAAQLRKAIDTLDTARAEIDEDKAHVGVAQTAGGQPPREHGPLSPEDAAESAATDTNPPAPASAPSVDECVHRFERAFKRRVAWNGTNDPLTLDEVQGWLETSFTRDWPVIRAATRGAGTVDVEKLLLTIREHDRTPTYEYGEPLRTGKKPGPGQRFLTPRELVDVHRVSAMRGTGTEKGAQGG